MELPTDDRARGMLEDHNVLVLHYFFNDSGLHAFVYNVETWIPRGLLIVELKETLQPLFQFGRRLHDLSGILWSIHRCKPEHMFEQHFGLLLRPQQHGVILGLVVLVDERRGQRGLSAYARVFP